MPTSQFHLPAWDIIARRENACLLMLTRPREVNTNRTQYHLPADRFMLAGWENKSPGLAFYRLLARCGWMYVWGREVTGWNRFFYPVFPPSTTCRSKRAGHGTARHRIENVSNSQPSHQVSLTSITPNSTVPPVPFHQYRNNKPTYSMKPSEFFISLVFFIFDLIYLWVFPKPK